MRIIGRKYRNKWAAHMKYMCLLLKYMEEPCCSKSLSSTAMSDSLVDTSTISDYQDYDDNTESEAEKDQETRTVVSVLRLCPLPI